MEEEVQYLLLHSLQNFQLSLNLIYQFFSYFIIHLIIFNNIYFSMVKVKEGQVHKYEKIVYLQQKQKYYKQLLNIFMNRKTFMFVEKSGCRLQKNQYSYLHNQKRIKEVKVYYYSWKKQKTVDQWKNFVDDFDLSVIRTVHFL